MIDSIRQYRLKFWLIFVMGLFSVSACTDQTNSVTIQDDTASMAFSVPARIADVRAIDQEDLILQITIGEAVDVITPDASGLYVFRTVLPANSQFDIRIDWFEHIVADNRDLRLASAEKSLSVGPASGPSVTIVFRENELDVSFDLDDDGFPNLEERRNGTDYNDNTDPDQPPVMVPFNVQADLPVQLEDSSDDIRSGIFLEVQVNGVNLPLSRDEQQWTGSTMVTENSEPQVRLDFYLTTQRSLKLAQLLRSQNAQQGITAIFEADDYEADALDDDSDGFNNIEEIANGTNPRDSADPPRDGDNDGVPDIMDNCLTTPNPSQSDLDSDGLGDACDSVNELDLDNDNVNDDVDNCPNASNESQADIDGDGIGDACDVNNALDVDGDMVNNDEDNCPSSANADQSDIDNDGIGDKCDPINDDPDGDEVNNPLDNCPDTPNPDQADSDSNGIGDACEFVNQ